MFAGVDADAFDFTALFLSGVFGILMADIFFVRSIVLLSEEISQDACCHLRAHCTWIFLPIISGRHIFRKVDCFVE